MPYFELWPILPGCIFVGKPNPQKEIHPASAKRVEQKDNCPPTLLAFHHPPPKGP
jgi:hypothetical protein